MQWLLGQQKKETIVSQKKGFEKTFILDEKKWKSKQPLLFSEITK